MRVLIIDNFDSFTFNLYQCIAEILLLAPNRSFFKPDLKVVRNNEITLNEIEQYDPTHIVLSPGPGTPADRGYFGICEDVILNLGRGIPILGVCLGMQGIAYSFGGKVVRAPTPIHGKTSKISHTNRGVFHGLPQNLEVMRYHSLMVEQVSIPDCLEITASAFDKSHTTQEKSVEVIMGIRHLEYAIEGVQFHPESFATEESHNILSNFLSQSVHQDSVHKAMSLSG